MPDQKRKKTLPERLIKDYASAQTGKGDPNTRNMGSPALPRGREQRFGPVVPPPGAKVPERRAAGESAQPRNRKKPRVTRG